MASLTFLDPVSPYGYGGTHPTAPPASPTLPGPGGGGINPEVVARLRAGDTSAESPFSPRSVFRAFYVAPGYARAAGGPLRRRDPQDPPRRRELPRRRHGLGELAGVRARHVGHPQRALAAVLPLGRHRRPRPQAAGAVDARRRRPRGGRRVAAGAGDARRFGRGAGLAGRRRLPAAADGGADPRGAGALRRGGRFGAHRDHRRVGPRPAPRRGAAVARDLPRRSLRRSGERPSEVGRSRPMEGRARQREGPARPGSRAARAVRRGAPAGLRLPAGALRASGPRRGPDGRDVPRRRRRVSARATAGAQHRLAGRHRPAQARRPLAGRRARGPRARGRRRART